MNKEKKIKELIQLVKKLRDPKKGCNWDKKQSLESLIPHSIEEVYEVADEIYKKNFKGIKEELGDLLFQIIFICQIADEKKKFNFDQVVDNIINKMIMRHPHVFKNKKFKNKKEFENFWENSKVRKNPGLLGNIPKTFPAMLKAYKIQKIVSRAGFDYSSDINALNKIIEEAKELKKEIKLKDRRKIKEELGDLIFATIDMSRKLKLDPEKILFQSNKKFTKRWEKIEKYVKIDNKVIHKLSILDFEKYWKKAKL